MSELSKSGRKDNHQSFVARLGAKLDPLTYVIGDWYHKPGIEIADWTNETLSKVAKKDPMIRLDRKYGLGQKGSPLRGVSDWAQNKPGDTIGIVVGTIATAGALGGAAGGAAGGGTTAAGGGAAAGAGAGAGAGAVEGITLAGGAGSGVLAGGGGAAAAGGGAAAGAAGGGFGTLGGLVGGANAAAASGGAEGVTLAGGAGSGVTAGSSGGLSLPNFLSNLKGSGGGGGGQTPSIMPPDTSGSIADLTDTRGPTPAELVRSIGLIG